MSDEPKIKPPYVSYTTFKNLLGSMKELVPARIDSTNPFMIGQSGSNQAFLMTALRFFGLVNDKTPTPLLRTLAQAEGEQKKSIWKQVFTNAYAPIIGDLDLMTASAGMLHEKFREQDLTGETINKCFSFFVAGAEDAEIPLAKHLKPGARTGGATGSRKPRKPRPANGPTGQSDPTPLYTPLPSLPQHNVAVLPLNADGTRVVKLQAPATVTKTELDRITQWLSFQLIVEA